MRNAKIIYLLLIGLMFCGGCSKKGQVINLPSGPSQAYMQQILQLGSGGIYKMWIDNANVIHGYCGQYRFAMDSTFKITFWDSGYLATLCQNIIYNDGSATVYAYNTGPPSFNIYRSNDYGKAFTSVYSFITKSGNTDTTYTQAIYTPVMLNPGLAIFWSQGFATWTGGYYTDSARLYMVSPATGAVLKKNTWVPGGFYTPGTNFGPIAMVFSDSLTGYMANQGYVYNTYDGGRSWESYQKSLTPNRLYIMGPGKLFGAAIGQQGGYPSVWYTNNYAQSWTQPALFNDCQVGDAQVLSDGSIILNAVTYPIGVTGTTGTYFFYKSTDQGQTWARLNTVATQGGSQYISTSGLGVCYGPYSNLTTTNNGGVTWAQPW